MNISPARTAAFDVLLRVETERSFTSVLLPQYESRLSEHDRGLCHELVLGSLRQQIYLDRVIDTYAAGKKLDAAVRIALRLGIYQLYFLDKIPARSAVNESVNLVQRAHKTSAKGLVNAILRRASTEKVELSFSDDVDKLSIETSHPPWLLEGWVEQFGLEHAVATASANNHVGRHAFRLIGDEHIDLPGFERSKYVDGCFLVAKLNRRLIQLAERGDIYFQDEASQMVASAVEIPKGGVFLDVCAAPGGKTGLVTRKYGGQIETAVAGDLYWPRIVTLRDSCRKQGIETVSILQYDAEQGLPFADESFDTVLLDAPCSGTGTIRHNPEIRYFLQASDIGELAEKQLRLLINASKVVKRGGSLVYSTCSLERQENEEVIKCLLSENSIFDTVTPKVPGRFVTDDGFARTFPDRDEMDGFFVAELRRK
jgi:16S rRNA (cytosine967-C5)-methyltransferase